MIQRLLSSKAWNADLASLFLRLTFGISMLIFHGYTKLMRWDEISVEFAQPFGLPDYWAAALTVFAEFFCCIFIALGLFTRFAAIPIIICMAVAAFKIHAGDPWEDKEASLGYMMAFVAVFLLGSGKYSIDNFLFNKKK
ncbi:MAG: DoxX family protein [Flavobacteriales bacterium]